MLRRPEVHRKATDYLPCTFCFAFIQTKVLTVHVQNCLMNLHKFSKHCPRTDGMLILSPYLPKEPLLKELLLFGTKETTENKGSYRREQLSLLVDVLFIRNPIAASWLYFLS